jgi:hypothetical protein
MKIFMEHLELTRVMFVTGSIRVSRTKDSKISLKNKLPNKVKRTVEVKKVMGMRRKKKQV